MTDQSCVLWKMCECVRVCGGGVRERNNVNVIIIIVQLT